ncbi:hypothetical protein FB45DRAFT_887163 [Roridomyces roridus]|uniref:GPI anchored protein n=1 Tax=Roridomyces roridus TaxID=1738132 RepID=A0AAD7G101_9AGAR|nr:hypothetical protein FB45DRAFT_887163 [Roridomyces roridus]
MFATLLTVALFAAPAFIGVSAADADAGSLTAPSSLTQCGALHLSWDNVKYPVDVAIVDAADPCGPVVADLGVHSVGSITWTVNMTSSTTKKYYISVVDDDENELWSDALEVQPSSDSSCFNNAVVNSSPSASAVVAPLPTETVGAAGAAVTNDPTTDGSSPLGAAGAGSSNGAGVLHMNPIMALGAVFAVAMML